MTKNERSSTALFSQDKAAFNRPRPQEASAQSRVGIDAERERIHLVREREFIQGLYVPAYRRQTIDGEPLMGRGVARVDGDRSPKLLFRAGPIPIVDRLYATESGTRGGQLPINLQR